MRSAMDRVKVYMDHKGVDWTELGMLSNLSPNRLVDLHTGRQGQMELWECQAIARALDAPFSDLFADHSSDLTADDILRDLSIARLIRELGRSETMARLTNPNFRGRRRSCSCGSPSAQA